MKPTTNIPRRPQYRGGRSSSVQDLSEAAQAIASILYRCLSTKLVWAQRTLWIIAAGFKEKPYKVGVGFLKVGVHLDNVIDVNSVSDTDLCDCDVKKSLWVKVSKMKNCMQLLRLWVWQTLKIETYWHDSLVYFAWWVAGTVRKSFNSNEQSSHVPSND